MKKFIDYKDKITYPVLVSYKLDGIFCEVINNRPYSKNGKEFKKVKDIECEDGTQGELYCHGADFEDIVSAIAGNCNINIEFYEHDKIQKIEINSEVELYNELENSIKNGYEGLVVHTSIGVFKLKNVIDSEFEVIGVVEGKGKLSGMAGKLIFNGFSAGIKRSHKYLKYIYDNRDNIIGKMATVEYQSMTRNNIPRFPKVKHIRDYEDSNI